MMGCVIFSGSVFADPSYTDYKKYCREAGAGGTYICRPAKVLNIDYYGQAILFDNIYGFVDSCPYSGFPPGQCQPRAHSINEFYTFMSASLAAQQRYKCGPPVFKKIDYFVESGYRADGSREYLATDSCKMDLYGFDSATSQCLPPEQISSANYIGFDCYVHKVINYFCPINSVLQKPISAPGGSVCVLNAQPPKCPSTPNPVSLFAGEKRFDHVVDNFLLNLFYYNRSYSSLPTYGQSSQITDQTALDGRETWKTSYDSYLIRTSGFEGEGAIYAASIPGEPPYTFKRTGSQLISIDGSKGAILRTNGLSQYLLGGFNGLIYKFSSEGMLLGIANTNGRSISLQRGNDGKINIASDDFGREVKFIRPEPSSLELWYADEKAVSYRVDDMGRLKTVGFPAIAGEIAQQQYIYDDEKWQYSITGIMDEAGKRIGKYTYSTPDGKVSRTEKILSSGSVDVYEIKYPSNTSRVIVGPNGRESTYTFGESGGSTDLPINNSQEAGAGCLASTSHLDYDTSGNVVGKEDFNGHRTCYARDQNRNLEIRRVEGLSATVVCATVNGGGATLPIGSRKISTQWHPDWAIKTRQAEPNKLTTWVYNGQPDPFNDNQPLFCTSPKYGASSVAPLPDDKPIAVLCKEVVQATLDATGAQDLNPTLNNANTSVAWQSTSTYTYNQYGQMLSSVDANGRTTSYEYYCQGSQYCTGTDKHEFAGTAPQEMGHYQGDLWKVTNAKGHVTQYTSYDRAGKVLSMVDPNSVTTTYSYWPRGWIKTQNQAGQLTSYDYWPTGLLKKVTQPNGSYLSYLYDDAHRLTDVTDNLGNTVHYTLDNAGNRIGEDVKDTSTNLTRNISRTYDALNRLQTVTGAPQ